MQQNSYLAVLRASIIRSKNQLIKLSLIAALLTLSATSTAAIVNFERTVVVSPTGITATDNGLLLIAALNSVAAGPPVPSATDRFLIKLEPGVYDLASNSIELPAWVDLEGSGEGITLIRGTVMSLSTCQRGLVAVRENAEIRHLSVENNTGVDFDSAALQLAQGSSAQHVTLLATGASEVNRGLLVQPTCPELLVSAPLPRASDITVTAATRAVHVFAPGLEAENIVADGTQGLFVSSGDVQVRNSRLVGTQFSVLAAISNADFITTQIDGVFSCNFATCRCFASYNGDLQALDANCAVLKVKKPKKVK